MNKIATDRYYRVLKEHALAVLLIYAVVIRLIIAFCYPAVSYFKDSDEYVELAQRFMDGSFQGYDGARTPAFPGFMALLGNNDTLVVIAQNIFGIIAVLLIYKMAASMMSGSWALLCGLILSSYLPFVFYDFAILTESLSTFFLVFSLFLVWKFKLFELTAGLWQLVLVSMVMSVLFLIKPLFLYVPFALILLLMIKAFKVRIKIYLLKILTLAVIPFITFYSWNKINEWNTGQFMTAKYMGIYRTQVVTSFFEKIPDEENVIREILLKNRRKAAALNNPEQYPMATWYARPELNEALGTTDLELSIKLKKVATDLIIANPLDYLRQVGISFLKFYSADSTLLWNVEKFRSVTVSKLFVGSWLFLQRYALLFLNSVFLILPLVSFALKSKWNAFAKGLYAIILLGSILQAMVAYGENSRYCYPFTPLILLLVCYAVYEINSKNSARNTI